MKILTSASEEACYISCPLSVSGLHSLVKKSNKAILSMTMMLLAHQVGHPTRTAIFQDPHVTLPGGCGTTFHVLSESLQNSLQYI
jgi:hypothetical protein